MEDIVPNKDIDTKSPTNGINEQIASLQAQIAELTKNNNNKANAPSNELGSVDYNFINNSEETPVDEKKTLLLGATINEEIKTMYASLSEYKDYLTTSDKQKIDYVLQNTDKNLANDSSDLYVIKNDLALLTCKIFFDYDGVDVPEHLKKKVEKVKNATRYTASIKEEVRDLLPHVPYMQKNLQSTIDRKKNSGLNFDGFNTSKRNVEWYIKNYSQGRTTFKEMQGYLNNNPAEKQRYHELIDNSINSFCQERGYKRPTGIMRGIDNYTFKVSDK